MKVATRRTLVACGLTFGAMTLMAFAARDVIQPHGGARASITQQDALWQSLWNECNQLWRDNQFDTQRHGVRDAQQLTLPDPSNPSARIPGPTATVWPREGNHQASQDGLRSGRPSARNRGGRVIARVEVAGDYAPLGFRSGINCVAIENIDYSQTCDNAQPIGSGNQPNGTAWIVRPDRTLETTGLCYTQNPAVNGQRQENYESRALWVSPNDGLWVSCSRFGCCYVVE